LTGGRGAEKRDLAGGKSPQEYDAKELQKKLTTKKKKDEYRAGGTCGPEEEGGGKR